MASHLEIFALSPEASVWTSFSWAFRFSQRDSADSALFSLLANFYSRSLILRSDYFFWIVKVLLVLKARTLLTSSASWSRLRAASSGQISIFPDPISYPFSRLAIPRSRSFSYSRSCISQFAPESVNWEPFRGPCARIQACLRFDRKSGRGPRLVLSYSPSNSHTILVFCWLLCSVWPIFPRRLVCSVKIPGRICLFPFRWRPGLF